MNLIPSSIQSGGTSAGTVTLNGPAPASGFVVYLTSSTGSATVPNSVTVGAGATSAAFTVSTIAVNAQTIATITGTDNNGKTASAQLTLQQNVSQSVQIVNLAVNDMTFDPVSGNIWAVLQPTDVNYPNSIVAINPSTGAIGTVIPMGVAPGHIAVTDDGQFAYMDSPSDGSIRRANLTTGTVGSIFAIGVGGVYDLETVPGSPHSFVIATDPTYGVNTSVWDDGVRRPGTGAGGNDVRFAGSGPTLYGDGGGQLFVNTVTAGGIQWTDSISINVHGFVWANNLLYTANPNVIDPVQKIVVESLPTTHFLTDREVAVSTADNRIYYVSWDSSHNKRILDFDLTTYQEHPLFDTGSIPGGCNHFVACGNHTVAFYIFGSGVTQNLVIVRNLQ